MTVPILVANQPLIMCNVADRDPLQNRFTGPEFQILAMNNKISGKVPIALMPGIINGISATMTLRGFSPSFYLLGGPTMVDFLPPTQGAPSVSHPLWSNPFWKSSWGYTQAERGYLNAGEGNKGGWIAEKGRVYAEGKDAKTRITIRGYTQNLGNVYGNAPNILGQAYQLDANGQWIFPDTALSLKHVDVIGGDNGLRGQFEWVRLNDVNFIKANNGSGNNHAMYFTTHALVSSDCNISGTVAGHDYKILAEHGCGVAIIYRTKFPRNDLMGGSYRVDGNTGDYFLIGLDTTDAPGDANPSTMFRLNVGRKIGGPSSFNILGSFLDADIPKVLGAFFRLDDEAYWYDDTGKTPNDPGWNYQTAAKHQIKNADGTLVYNDVTVYDDGNVFLWNESANLTYSYGASLEKSGNLLLPNRPNIERIRGKNIAMNRLDPKVGSTAITRLDFSGIVAKYGRLGEMVRDGNDPAFFDDDARMDELVAVQKARNALWKQPVGIGQVPPPAGPKSFYNIGTITPAPAPGTTPEKPPVVVVPAPTGDKPPAETPPPVVVVPPPIDFKALYETAKAENIQLHDAVTHLNETILTERAEAAAALGVRTKELQDALDVIAAKNNLLAATSGVLEEIANLAANQFHRIG